jgi:hypothetical protein
MATSNLLVSGPINWTTFYERNRYDGGGIQRLFEANLATLSIITASHFKKPEKLVETIAGSPYANMVMVAGDNNGMVNILHHGFVSTTSFGGEVSILFLSGNSSEAPLKALSHSSAVVPIKASSGRTRGGGAAPDAPTFTDMWEVGSETEFSNLRSSGNNILREKPNHMMIGPAVFDLAGGVQRRVRAGSLAYEIITRLRDQDDSLEDPSDEGKEPLAQSHHSDKTREDRTYNKFTENATTSTPPTTNKARRRPPERTDVIELSRGVLADGNDDESGGTPSPLDNTAILQRPRGGAGANVNPADNLPGTTLTENNDHIEHLLAWLWACEKKIVSSKLSDPIYDDLLLPRLRGIRTKLNAGPPVVPTHIDQGETPPRTDTNTTGWQHATREEDPLSLSNNARGLSNLALMTKEIAEVLERMESNRCQENRKKEDDKSFLRNLGTMQQELFSTLCTNELGKILEQPKFLKSLMDTKTPQKAIAMIRSFLWEWEGSFFDGPFTGSCEWLLGQRRQQREPRWLHPVHVLPQECGGVSKHKQV